MGDEAGDTEVGEAWQALRHLEAEDAVGAPHGSGGGGDLVDAQEVRRLVRHLERRRHEDQQQAAGEAESQHQPLRGEIRHRLFIQRSVDRALHLPGLVNARKGVREK